MATAKNPAGQVIASGNDQMFSPNLVRSGGLSFGYAYFGGVELPPDTTFEVDLGSTPATDDEFENARDLRVVEASTIEGRVVGTLQNIYDAELTGPISVSAVCLDEAGNLLSHHQSFSSKETVGPQETLTFQVDNFTTGVCPLFLVAGSGWDNTFGPNNSVQPPGSDSESAVSVAEEATPAPISVGQTQCADLTSAESILLSLQSAGLPIGEYVVYTAEDDPNALLGRPGQYIAKTNFVDTRLGSGSSLFDIGEGGSIEVFETAELAQARADYITGIIAANPILVEYDFLNGPVLLRISGTMTPDQAALYEEALLGIASY